MSELTEKQEKFLTLIFLPEYTNDYQKAKVDAGYHPASSLPDIIKSVKEHIIDRIELELTLGAPKAVAKLFQVMQTPDAKGAKTALDAAGTVLDRVGIVKKEKIELEHKNINGIFIMPSKKPVE